ICARLDRDPALKPVQQKLERLAVALWEQNSRRLEYAKAKTLLDEAGAAGWNETFTKNLIEEGILQRSWWKSEEYVGFSYDLMAGYMFAKGLFSGDPLSAKQFLNGAVVRTRLFSEAVEDL